MLATTKEQRDVLASSQPTGATPWLAIERATNGYLVRDSAAREIWLIADEDWLEAAAELLAEINSRLGSAGDTYDERRVMVTLEPGERWLAAKPEDCKHDRIRNRSLGASGRWACACGLEFVPAPRSAEAGEAS
jgi:hypothetical protein